jgi:hypothetical protein
MARYAHYVLLRTQCFGGMFREITDSGNAPSSKHSRSRASVAQKPITATALRAEHLEASRMLLKDGCACALKDGEECENTAMCVERVAADLIGLTTAVATSLNRALSKDGTKGTDAALLQKWCEFYSDELLPQTKSMVKKTSAKLDAYGLFLPSRMGASVSPELLQKGLKGAEEEEKSSEGKDESITEAPVAVKKEKTDGEVATEKVPVKKEVEVEEEEVEEPEEVEEEEELDEYDEYDYEEEEYYDDEEA